VSLEPGARSHPQSLALPQPPQQVLELLLEPQPLLLEPQVQPQEPQPLVLEPQGQRAVSR